MKKSIVILISCLIFAQLHAQQNPTTSSTPEQDTTNVNIEVIHCVESDADATEKTSESVPPNDEEDYQESIVELDDFQSKDTDIARVDSTKVPIHQEPDVSPPNNENDDETENAIVVLDDFQSIQPLERKRTFLSFLSSLFKKKKRNNTEIINSTVTI